MTAVIIGLLICLALSAIVMGLVVVPARRDGRDVLTARAERVVVKVRERTPSAGATAAGSQDQR